MKVRYCRKCPKCRRRAWKGERRTKRDRYVRVEYAFAWCVLHKKRCRDVRDCSIALAHQVKMELGEKYREQERDCAFE